MVNSVIQNYAVFHVEESTIRQSVPRPHRGREPAAQTESPVTGLNPAASPFQPPMTTSMFLVNVRGPVLLQTARVKLFNPENPERMIEVRAILNTGRQQSYATDKVKNVLSLRCHKKLTMFLMTFGASDKRAQTYDVVGIGVTTKDSHSGLLRKPKPALQVSKSYNIPTQELLVLVKDQM